MELILSKNKPCEGRQHFSRQKMVREIIMFAPRLDVLLERITVVNPGQRPVTVFSGAMELRHMSHPLTSHSSLYARKFNLYVKVKADGDLRVTFRSPDDGCGIEWRAE